MKSLLGISLSVLLILAVSAGCASEPVNSSDTSEELASSYASSGAGQPPKDKKPSPSPVVSAAAVTSTPLPPPEAEEEVASVPESSAAVDEERDNSEDEGPPADGEESEPEPISSAELPPGELTDGVIPGSADSPLSTVLSPEASGTRAESCVYACIDYSHCEDGYVMAAWFAGGEDRVKVLIQGPDGARYQFNLRRDGEYETFPLSEGSGEYVIGIYRNMGGNSYATVLSAAIYVELSDPFAAFLRPNQYIFYTEESKAVIKAAELCSGADDTLDKVRAIYEFAVSHISYDHEKAASVQIGYLPDIDDTLLTGKGICFDYAALMTAMLRSQNVPAKLIVGYTGDAYHAWINVFSEEEGWIDAAIYFDGVQWKLMDPTFASNAGSGDDIMRYIGNGSNYTAKYQY